MFNEFLNGLGWLVEPLSHSGFAGKIRASKADDSGRPVGIMAQIPTRPFHYYADAMRECAFVIPVFSACNSDSASSLRSGESSDSGQDAASIVTQASMFGAERDGSYPQSSTSSSIHNSYGLPQGRERDSNSPTTTQGSSGSHVPVGSSATTHAHGEKEKPRGKMSVSNSRSEQPSCESARRRSGVPQDCGVMVVWLEHYEDHVSFPVEVLSAVLHGRSAAGTTSSIKLAIRRSLPCIFIHCLPSGLYQITTRSPR